MIDDPHFDPSTSPIAGEYVLLKHATHNTYLKDDGDGSIPNASYNSLSASQTPDSDNFSWLVINGSFGIQYKNKATGKYLKAKPTFCFSGSITGSGDAASWNEFNVNDNTTMKDYKRSTCCHVDSAIDASISTGSCSTPNAYVEVEETL